MDLSEFKPSLVCKVSSGQPGQHNKTPSQGGNNTIKCFIQSSQFFKKVCLFNSLKITNISSSPTLSYFAFSPIKFTTVRYTVWYVYSLCLFISLSSSTGMWAISGKYLCFVVFQAPRTVPGTKVYLLTTAHLINLSVQSCVQISVPSLDYIYLQS